MLYLGIGFSQGNIMAQDRKLNGIAAQTVIDALNAEGVNLLQTSKRLGVYRPHLYVHIKNRPTLMEAWENSKEIQLDKSEEKLFEARDRGERWAIMYHLSTQGRSRGWGSPNNAPTVLGDQINVTSITIKAIESDSFADDRAQSVVIHQIEAPAEDDDELFQIDIAAE
jgi:hypothetical protein